jgi:glucosyl-dolichyl phosphate glucuronosyltransferase
VLHAAARTGRVAAAEGSEDAASPRGWPSISVCVCTHDRPQYLASCLDSLRAQTAGLDGFEIVVVDSGCAPAAAAAVAGMVAALPNARLVRLDRPGVSAARNAGARAAAGDYVAYLDDDALAAPDWIDQIRRVIGEEERPPAVLGGRVLPRWERPLPGGGRPP